MTCCDLCDAEDIKTQAVLGITVVDDEGNPWRMCPDCLGLHHKALAMGRPPPLYRSFNSDYRREVARKRLRAERRPRRQEKE